MIHCRVHGRHSLNVGLMCFDAIGYIFFSSVSAAVILNYGIHCEMIVCFVDGVVSMLRERKLNLNAAIKVGLGFRW